MRYVSKVSVLYNDYNEFGEEVETNRATMKCLIISRTKKNDVAETNVGFNFAKKYDMELITGKKNFQPYSDLFQNDAITIEYDNIQYKPKIIDELRDINGKIKQYIINCEVI